MAIEIVPKPAPKGPFLINGLFYLSLLALLAIISGHFVLSSMLKKDLNRLREFDEQISKAKSPEEISLEKMVVTEKKKIDDFSRLIRERKFPSKFFGFSEGPFSQTKKFAGLIHPQVQLLSFSLNVKGSRVDVSGLTENFTTLEQQLKIFQKEPLVRKTNISGFSVGKEGKVNFTLDLSFDSSIFK